MAVEAPVRKEHLVFRDSAQRIDIRCTTREFEPLDMTGYSLRWRLKTAKSGTTIVEKTNAVGGGIVLVSADGTNDEAQVTVKHTDWATTAEGNYYHVLERTDTNAEDVLSFGAFYLNQT